MDKCITCSVFSPEILITLSLSGVYFISALIFQLAIGLVVALNYQNPFMSPYDEFQVSQISMGMFFYDGSVLV